MSQLGERKYIIADLHQEIGHFGESRTLVKMYKKFY
jgi:hypothetical protein